MAIDNFNLQHNQMFRIRLEIPFHSLLILVIIAKKLEEKTSADAISKYILHII